MMARRLGQAVLAIGLTLAVAAPARADEHWIKLPTAPYTLNNKQDAIAFRRRPDRLVRQRHRPPLSHR